jgi:hypothetical protein
LYLGIGELGRIVKSNRQTTIYIGVQFVCSGGGGQDGNGEGERIVNVTIDAY